MNQNSKRARQLLKEAVKRLFEQLPTDQVQVPEALQLQIAALAEFAVRARTHVPRDSRKTVVYVPEPEAATRLAQQLCQLAKGAARLAGRPVVAPDDVALAQRVAFDCIPAVRMAVLRSALLGHSLTSLDLPKATLSYVREDLGLQCLIHDGKKPGIDLSPLAIELLTTAGCFNRLDKEEVHQKSPRRVSNRQPQFTRSPPRTRKEKKEGVEHVVNQSHGKKRRRSPQQLDADSLSPNDAVPDEFMKDEF